MRRLADVRATMLPLLDGILGPDALWEAVAERAGDHGGHRVARLRVRVPDRYRLDYTAGDWDKRYTSIACDGEHTTKLSGDRVATGPARPLEADFTALLDPAWLLSGWRLLSASPVTLAGRPRVPPAGRDHRDGRRQRRPSLYARGSGRGHRARDRRAPDDLRPTSATSRRPAPSCGS
jgi:hypothetical protein